jgi:hypothetical protein
VGNKYWYRRRPHKFFGLNPNVTRMQSNTRICCPAPIVKTKPVRASSDRASKQAINAYIFWEEFVASVHKLLRFACLNLQIQSDDLPDSVHAFVRPRCA